MIRHHPPSLVFAASFGLSLTAGWINAIGYLGVAHQAITHVTGTVSIGAIELGRGRSDLALRAFAVATCFFLGAATSGLVVRDPKRQRSRRYGVALMIEGVLLTAALVYFRGGSMTGEYFGAVAAGIQNALATSYTGAAIRTTHLTGVVTDLGLALGLAIGRRQVDNFRVAVNVVVLMGFFAGAVGGGLAYLSVGYDALWAPALATFSSGLGYTALQTRRRRLRARAGDTRISEPPTRNPSEAPAPR